MGNPANDVDFDLDKEDIYPQLFGKYIVLEQIAEGGMAKICIARFVGNDVGQEVERLTVLKMIKKENSKDPNFKKMFLDEVKVVFGLAHPNIVQTFDYGYANGQLYTTMEHVEGANIKQFIDALKNKKKRFGTDIAVYIAKIVSEALHYAHSYKDKLTGQHYHIIHRDISPDNVMINFDGAIKLIDFGIAQTDIKNDKTATGIVKGKVSYMAPEYITGSHEVDGRYDQYAVALTLWEMLTNRRCFVADTNMATLHKVIKEEIPAPSTFNKKIPKELDAIILKACHKDPTQRYENMEEFAIALNSFLNKNYPDFHPSIIKKYALALFGEQIKANQEKFMEYGKVDIQSLMADEQTVQTKISSAVSIEVSSDDFEEGNEASRQFILDMNKDIQENVSPQTEAPSQKKEEEEDWPDPSKSLRNGQEEPGYKDVLPGLTIEEPQSEEWEEEEEEEEEEYENEEDMEANEQAFHKKKHWRTALKDEREAEDAAIKRRINPLHLAFYALAGLIIILATAYVFRKPIIQKFGLENQEQVNKVLTEAERVELQHKRKIEEMQEEKRDKKFKKFEF